MTDKVHVLKPTPDPDVIAALRDVLERAERGEVQCVAGVAIEAGGDLVTFRSRKVVELFQLIGGLRILEHKLMGDVET